MTLGVLLVSFFTLIQFNCENLFDCVDDPKKADEEFLPDAYRHWTKGRYWKKLNGIGQEIVACGGEGDNWKLPDLVALCEVENDSVMRDLTKRSLLRTAGYEYVVTHSPDIRGINVALMYSPFTFRLLHHQSITVPLVKDMRPTRDILYVKGTVITGDTLHVFVLHAPSRSMGEATSRPYRVAVAKRLCSVTDSIRRVNAHAEIIVAGDFNDYGKAEALQRISENGLVDVTKDAKGKNGSKGTYRYHGEWGSLDHVFVSSTMAARWVESFIYDADFLLEDDEKYGGKHPKRTYLGPKYIGGYSDHLPLVVRFCLKEKTSASYDR